MGAVIFALILIGIILLIFSWLIFWPWIVEVDTSHNTYQLYQAGTFRFWLSAGFQPHLSILGISVPLKSGEKKRPKKESTSPKKEKKKNIRIKSLMKLWNGIVRGINVKWFYLDLDTDDVVLNAQLIPAFQGLSRGPVHLTTNFEGRVSSRLRAELKLYRMGWAFLLFLIKK